jgi:TDG/mug DNA glycosylase family protein
VSRTSADTTLPDLLRPGLAVVFVGINPSIYSVQQGHYFARRSNRFWPCLSASVLSAAARAGLSAEALEPRHDRALLTYGIGFTDVVKRATAKASELSAEELSAGARDLVTRLKRHRPLVACFHGVTGYRAAQRALTGTQEPIVLGAQPVKVGQTYIFVVPNPSGANAHFTREEQTGWYDQLATFMRRQTGR